MGYRLPMRQGWSTGKPGGDSRWMQRNYGDTWMWIEWWDAPTQRWYVKPGGRRCVMQGKPWREIPSNSVIKDGKICLREPTGSSILAPDENNG